jgi:Family of unknown function (DUF6677)
MAEPQTTTTSDTQTRAAAPPVTTMTVLAPALAWFIPGAGHLVQRRWVRGLLLMISVVAMFAFGLAMEGKIYKPNTGDLLDILGFVSDLGAGILYIIGRAMDWGGPAISTAAADYGTKYIAVAGLLNIIGAVDAYHIAIGKKQ